MSNKPYLEQADLHVEAPFRAALLTYPGNFQEALRQGKDDVTKTLFGVGQGIPSVFATKVLASAKPDFIWFDVEHAMFDRMMLHDCIHATQAHSEGKTMAVVRVPKHDEAYLSTALDAGAAAIVIPHCESAEEVREKLKEIYYPPVGERSFSPWTFTPGISDTSLYADDAFNMRTSNNHVAVIAQVESVRGVENVDEIAAVDGVAGLMFGPGDFMADARLPMKMGGEPHPVFADAMGKFVAAGKKHGRPLFGGSMSPEMVPMMLQQGYRAIAVGFDTWSLARVVDGGVKQARACAEEEAAASSPQKNNGTSN